MAARHDRHDSADSNKPRKAGQSGVIQSTENPCNDYLLTALPAMRRTHLRTDLVAGPRTSFRSSTTCFTSAS